MVTKTILEQEDRIDHVAKELIGTEQDGAVEALLEANPGLAAEGPFVAAGRELVVPDRPVKTVTIVSPWD